MTNDLFPGQKPSISWRLDVEVTHRCREGLLRYRANIQSGKTQVHGL